MEASGRANRFPLHSPTGESAGVQFPWPIGLTPEEGAFAEEGAPLHSGTMWEQCFPASRGVEPTSVGRGSLRVAPVTRVRRAAPSRCPAEMQ